MDLCHSNFHELGKCPYKNTSWIYVITILSYFYLCNFRLIPDYILLLYIHTCLYTNNFLFFCTFAPMQQDMPDTVTWRWTSDGVYSATSAYAMQFEGSSRCLFHKLIWNTEAPLKCRIFAWLAILGKCHTADCLMKKGWPHNSACVLCLSEPETALHLLGTCPVTIKIWKRLISVTGLPSSLAPSPTMTSLQDWLQNTKQAQPKTTRKHWASLVHLAWWMIWKERNSRVFQNTATSISRIHSNILDEARNWKDAGKTKAFDLLHRPREPD